MGYSRFIRTLAPRIRPAMAPLLAWVLCGLSPLFAGEADPYAEIVRRSHLVNDMLCKTIFDLELPEGPAATPDGLISLRKNARVTVGGDMRIGYTFSRGQWKDPGLNPALPARGKSRAKSGDLSLSSTKLLVGVEAGERWRAFFDLDLDGYHGLHRRSRVVNVTPPGQPASYERSRETDILAQAYVELLKDGHSGFGFRAGRMILPFGLWNRPRLFAQSFMDAPDLGGSFLMNTEGWDNAVRLPHASRLVDPVLAAELSYEMRDIVRFEAAVFRDTDESLRLSRRRSSPGHRRESTAPRSWQAGFSILPLEDWELTAHFRNRHSRSRGVRAWSDSPSRWDFGNNLASGRRDPRWDAALGQWSDGGDGASFSSRSSEQSLILGLAVEIPYTSLKVRAEYAHGWNQGFNKYINSDGISLGASYRLTPFLSLHIQGDWLHVKDRSWMGSDGRGGWMRDTRNNRLYRSFAGLEYEVTRGLTLEAGWQYEYWRITSSIGGPGGVSDRRLNTANTVYLGSRLVF